MWTENFVSTQFFLLNILNILIFFQDEFLKGILSTTNILKSKENNIGFKALIRATAHRILKVHLHRTQLIFQYISTTLQNHKSLNQVVKKSQKNRSSYHSFSVDHFKACSYRSNYSPSFRQFRTNKDNITKITEIALSTQFRGLDPSVVEVNVAHLWERQTDD